MYVYVCYSIAELCCKSSVRVLSVVTKLKIDGMGSWTQAHGPDAACVGLWTCAREHELVDLRLGALASYQATNPEIRRVCCGAELVDSRLGPLAVS